MAEEEAICHFNLLPLQTVYEILDLIPFCEKKKARLVCHEWRTMIDCQPSVVYRPVLTVNISMKYFLQSYRSMDNVIMENINMKKSKNMFGNSEYPRVKNGVLGWKNFQGNIERFLTQGCEFAESLTLREFSLERISRGALSKTLSEIDWRNLTRFEVMVTSPNHNYKDTGTLKHLRNVTIVLKYARIPSLEELEFNFDWRGEFPTKHKVQYQKLLMGLYLFLVGHSKTLKVLTGRVSTTHPYTIELPEIPMDFQQSLISSMKLQHFSLYLCRVRRFGSILIPALFGSELKILDIEIIEPDIWIDVRDGRLLRYDFGPNLQLLFERNGKTLTNVSLGLVICPFTLLENCTALESLEINYYTLKIEEPEDPSRLSHIKLKSFSSKNSCSGRFLDTSPGSIQLLRQSVGTLEHLSLFHSPRHHPIQFWVRDCVALKSLKIVHIDEEYIEANMGGQFPHLTELETHLSHENRSLATTWITESMRNLEIITITGECTDVQLLRTLFPLTKLKRIIFDKEGLYKPRQIQEVKEFCATNQIKCVNGRIIGRYGEFLFITLNPNQSIAHNPNQ